MPQFNAFVVCVLFALLPSFVIGQADGNRIQSIASQELGDSSYIPQLNSSALSKFEDEPRFFGKETNGTLLQWSGQQESGGPDLNEPIVTDRPDFTEASSTVGRGVAQLEIGYTYFHDNDGLTRATLHSYPETLLRFGILADWLELRAAWNYSTTHVTGLENSGANDLYLGVKIGLTPQQGILPEMALVPQMTVPTGTSGFSNGEALPGVNWLYGWDLTDRWSTAGSTQFNRTVDGGSGQANTRWAQSWTTGYALSDRAGAYAEWFALFPHSAETDRTEHYFDGGLTFLVNDDMQFDIRAGKGLSDASADFFVGTGLSIRFK